MSDDPIPFVEFKAVPQDGSTVQIHDPPSMEVYVFCDPNLPPKYTQPPWWAFWRKPQLIPPPPLPPGAIAVPIGRTAQETADNLKAKLAPGSLLRVKGPQE